MVLLKGGDDMLYCCEVCGKKFNTGEQALGCERVHSEERARREKLVKLKDEKTKEILNDYERLVKKYKQYFKDYGEYPIINISSIETLNPIGWIL